MTTIQLDSRELTTVLAALRCAQEHRFAFDQMPHFDEDEALSDDEIDELCERINTSD